MNQRKTTIISIDVEKHMAKTLLSIHDKLSTYWMKCELYRADNAHLNTLQLTVSQFRVRDGVPFASTRIRARRRDEKQSFPTGR